MARTLGKFEDLRSKLFRENGERLTRRVLPFGRMMACLSILLQHHWSVQALAVPRGVHYSTLGAERVVERQIQRIREKEFRKAFSWFDVFAKMEAGEEGYEGFQESIESDDCFRTLMEHESATVMLVSRDTLEPQFCSCLVRIVFKPRQEDDEDDDDDGDDDAISSSSNTAPATESLYFWWNMHLQERKRAKNVPELVIMGEPGPSAIWKVHEIIPEKDDMETFKNIRVDEETGEIIYAEDNEYYMEDEDGKMMRVDEDTFRAITDADDEDEDDDDDDDDDDLEGDDGEDNDWIS